MQASKRCFSEESVPAFFYESLPTVAHAAARTQRANAGFLRFRALLYIGLTLVKLVTASAREALTSLKERALLQLT